MVLLIIPETAFANNALSEFLTDIVGSFKTHGGAVGQRMQGIAIAIFKTLLFFEIVWLGIRLGLERADISKAFLELLKVVLVTAFIYTILFNYEYWTNAIVNGLSRAYGELTPAASQLGSPETSVINIYVKYLYNVIQDLSMSLKAIGQVFCIIIIGVSTATLTIFIASILIESYLVLNIGVVLMGFGSLWLSRDITVRYFQYILSVGMKLLSMKVLATIIEAYLMSRPAFIENTATFIDYIYATAAFIVITGLFKVVPSTVASLITQAGIGGGAAAAIMGAGGAAAAGAAMGSQVTGKGLSLAGSSADITGRIASGLGQGTEKLATAAGAGLMTATGVGAVAAPFVQAAGKAAGYAGKAAGVAGKVAKHTGHFSGAVLQGQGSAAAGMIKSGGSAAVKAAPAVGNASRKAVSMIKHIGK